MGELMRRIDATDSPNPPPSRRYRLVLDLHADSLAGLVEELAAVGADVWDHYHRETAPAMRTTHGGASNGWHVEVVDQGEAWTAEVYADALLSWVARPVSPVTDGKNDG